jgi:hypothetical protein
MLPFCRRELEKKQHEEPARQILFAQLVPSIKKLKGVKVKSVLSPLPFRFHCNPGAKRIDVISRVMFPGTFAFLNIAYWSYYLSAAENVSLDN